jgi:hypothetical protein
MNTRPCERTGSVRKNETLMRRRAQIAAAAAVVVIVAIVVIVALRFGRSDRRDDIGAAIAPARAENAVARPSPAGRKKTRLAANPSSEPLKVAADQTTTPTAGPTLIDQLIAIRAIASQAEVSSFLQRNADAAAKYVDRFCEESNRLKKKSPLRESTRERDAASYLAPLIDWETDPPRHRKLHLPEILTEKIKAAESRWPAAITAEDLAGLNFDWMRELRTFDHWSMLGAGPITERNGPDFDHALPHYAFFMHWSKLRFAYALELGGLAEASADVRHLAHLVHTQGVLITELIALMILKVEREAYDVAGGEIAGVEPYRVEELDRLRKLTRYSGSFFYPGVDPAVLKKALDCAPSPCPLLFEGSWLDAHVGELAGENTGLDIIEVYGAAGCDTSLLGHLPRQPASIEAARTLLDGPPELENLYPPGTD